MSQTTITHIYSGPLVKDNAARIKNKQINKIKHGK